MCFRRSPQVLYALYGHFSVFPQNLSLRQKMSEETKRKEKLEAQRGDVACAWSQRSVAELRTGFFLNPNLNQSVLPKRDHRASSQFTWYERLRHQKLHRGK